MWSHIAYDVLSEDAIERVASDAYAAGRHSGAARRMRGVKRAHSRAASRIGKADRRAPSGREDSDGLDTISAFGTGMVIFCIARACIMDDMADSGSQRQVGSVCEQGDAGAFGDAPDVRRAGVAGRLLGGE